MADLSKWTDDPYAGGGGPEDFARWESNHCAPWVDTTRRFLRDEGPYDMPMPHEIAKSKLDKLVSEELFYASELLNLACNGWYLGKQEHMEHLEKGLNEYRAKRIEQEVNFSVLYTEHKARIEEIRQYEVEHAEEQAAAWAKRIEWMNRNNQQAQEAVNE